MDSLNLIVWRFEIKNKPSFWKGQKFKYAKWRYRFPY